MKQTNVEQPERRRPLVELNLLGDVRVRAVRSARGCASMLSRVSLLLLALLVALASLK